MRVCKIDSQGSLIGEPEEMGLSERDCQELYRRTDEKDIVFFWRLVKQFRDAKKSGYKFSARMEELFLKYDPKFSAHTHYEEWVLIA